MVMAKKEKVEDKEEKELKKVKASFANETVIAEDSEETKELYESSRYGEPSSGRIRYALVEALFLLEKGRMDILDGKNKKIDFEHFVKKARDFEPNFWVRYCVYKDMRDRGYIIKTALKFGADFRVYDRGVKPGEDHAKWIVFPVHESSGFTWYEFASKNRVAHSTRKRLLLAIVDAESDTTYYEVAWKRP